MAAPWMCFANSSLTDASVSFELKPLAQEHILEYIQIRKIAREDMDHIAENCLKETNDKKKLTGLIGYLEKLQHLVLSSESYEISENIYKKRHFTVDIPSMYGSYHELKFDALGLSFRLEGLVNVLFESFVSEFDLSLITKATFFRIYDLLRFYKAIRCSAAAFTRSRTGLYGVAGTRDGLNVQSSLRASSGSVKSCV